ncbi:rhodanese-related sulfurtransferase [Neobacillus notoginsengisoli]|uniref:tRNA uridine(34) hydroxylase n=1 Tax=Neobacillus notoginsengisoli TaxID=1578198 RepID=A0A417YPT1_9BACI|nr:rhodanese-related sulfurtransferase [Neobacillus notoginsengisoli]RHW35726.1 rhodanese-related sulfurtransferase [Neobacillus notoginsengisoli]
MTEIHPYRVLLYYKYVHIENPEEFTAEHLAFCKELGLKGRILIAEEGINGTVSGTVEQTDAYMKAMKEDPRFADMVFKIDGADSHAFKKMHVRHRSELVTLRLEDDVDPNEVTGKYLEPKEFFEAMQDPNTVVVDARNDYEYDLGHFRGAIRPDITAFRELPEWIRENKEKLEGKKVLTYCTGGIRCEKFSGWLVKEGFEDVAQLHGGIATYGKDPEVKGQLWDGKMYVFDERISVPVNQVEHVVVGKDYFTGEPCERYVNCANPECNKQILCSEENEHKYMRSCTHECRVHPRNMYVKEHGLTEVEVAERIGKLGDEVPTAK